MQPTANTTLRFPDGATKPLAWLDAHPNASQRLLEECYASGQRIECLCHGNNANRNPMLYIRYKQKYLLARMPGTQNEHANNCPFGHLYPSHEENEIEQHDSAYKDLPNGKFTIAPSFILERTPHDIAKSIAGIEPKKSTTKSKASLLGVLQTLWEKSDNHRYYPERQRTWNRTAWFLNQTLIHGMFGTRPMSEVIHVPLWQKDDSHKRAFWTWSETLANENNTGKVGLIIGSVNSFKTHQNNNTTTAIEFTIKDLPCSINLNAYAIKSFEKSHSRQMNALNQLPTNKQFRSVGIFLVTNGHKTDVNGKLIKCLIASKASIMITTEHYIPVESKYELQMADNIAQAGRAYLKPLKLKGESFLPDFLIIDEKPAIFVEVFGIDGNAEYDQRKKEKVAEYQRKGHKLITWNAASEPMPNIPSKPSKDQSGND